MYETDLWPYLEAKHHGPKRSGNPRLIVVHTPIWREVEGSARALANYFKGMPEGREASVHISVDNQEIYQSVYDSFVPWAAAGANHDGLHIEIIGTHTQTRVQWRDKFSLGALALAADAAAQWAIKYNLPLTKLTNEQLARGFQGFVGHDQISLVYKKSTHTDPGPHFPWDRFMSYARGAWLERTRK